MINNERLTFFVVIEVMQRSRRIESSTSLGLVKWFVNGLLNVAGLGVTMTMLLRRSPVETTEGDRKVLHPKHYGQ